MNPSITIRLTRWSSASSNTHMNPSVPVKRIAVVGSGIAGLSAAWLLSRAYAVTLFEANDYLGGHTHTVDVKLDGITAPVDTGFLVFNERTYPNLIALFDYLGVTSTASDMSFSVKLEAERLEWAGSSLSTVFAQQASHMAQGAVDVAVGSWLRRKVRMSASTAWRIACRSCVRQDASPEMHLP